MSTEALLLRFINYFQDNVSSCCSGDCIGGHIFLGDEAKEFVRQFLAQDTEFRREEPEEDYTGPSLASIFNDLVTIAISDAFRNAGLDLSVERLKPLSPPEMLLLSAEHIDRLNAVTRLVDAFLLKAGITMCDMRSLIPSRTPSPSMDDDGLASALTHLRALVANIVPLPPHALRDDGGRIVDEAVQAFLAQKKPAVEEAPTRFGELELNLDEYGDVLPQPPAASSTTSSPPEQQEGQVLPQPSAQNAPVCDGSGYE